MPATPTITTIRDAIVLAVKTAMNSGSPGSVVTVHDYPRFWRDEDKFRTLFKRTDVGGDIPTGRLNGWMVKRATTREIESPEWFRFVQVHRFELFGVLAVQDAAASLATEKLFQDQVEKIRDNLRASTTVFATTEQTNPVTQVETFGQDTIGDTTFWTALLSLEAEGIETKFT